jgi:DNA-binding transcriptional LysR family regulator
MINLTELAIFAQVVESKSFSAAADQLGLSKSAVSKYITRLEACLGARLLLLRWRRLCWRSRWYLRFLIVAELIHRCQ